MRSGKRLDLSKAYMMREGHGKVALGSMWYSGRGAITRREDCIGALTECVEIELDGHGNQWHPVRPGISLDSSGARKSLGLGDSGLNKA